MLPKVRDGHFEGYSRRLLAALEACDWQPVSDLADELLDCARTGRQVGFFLEHDNGTDRPYVSPLFNERSLYRAEARV